MLYIKLNTIFTNLSKKKKPKLLIEVLALVKAKHPVEITFIFNNMLEN